MVTWHWPRHLTFTGLLVIPLYNLTAGPGGVTSIIDAGFCSQLPLATNEQLKPYAMVIQETPRDKIRVLLSDKAEKLLRQAVSLNWSTLEFFTQDGMREDCLYYIPRETLVSIDQKFDLKLLFAITANDADGEPFKMTAFFAGMGKHYIFYNRDDIVYKKTNDSRAYRFNWLIRQKTPRFGILEEIQGLEVRTINIEGVYEDWISVHSSIKISETQMSNQAGSLPRVTNPLDPIRPR
ncbi:MAG: hypothetical protein HY547_06145 [Elusimicrobia bacterium]|nr:hypothetical protein [Elusimicrobiota bacterium]